MNSPNIIIIFGPPAVGKMSVGRALAKITGYRLFHNHMTIDPVLNFFDYGTPAFGRLVNGFRMQVFEEVANSDLPGIIFTWVWAFDLDTEINYINRICTLFHEQGGQSYFVGLEAGLSYLLERNRSEERLLHKPSKRNLENSESHLKKLVREHQVMPPETFLFSERYIKINNENLSPEQAATQIKNNFLLKCSD